MATPYQKELINRLMDELCRESGVVKSSLMDVGIDFAEALFTNDNTRQPQVPVSGNHVRGEIMWNSLPSPGGSMGWVCVESGDPGVWREFGLISE